MLFSKIQTALSVSKIKHVFFDLESMFSKTVSEVGILKAPTEDCIHATLLLNLINSLSHSC